jgi:hypothetical protein
MVVTVYTGVVLMTESAIRNLITLLSPHIYFHRLLQSYIDIKVY